MVIANYKSVHIYLIIILFLSTTVSEAQVLSQDTKSKWEIVVAPSYFFNSGMIGSINNGSSIESKGGIAGSVSLNRNFIFFEEKKIGIAPSLGLELYPTVTFDAFLKPPTLPQDPMVIFPSTYSHKDYRIGVLFDLKLFYQVFIGKWEVFLNSGILYLPTSIDEKFSILIEENTPLRHEINYEKCNVFVGRFGMGLNRYFLVFEKKLGVGLSYLRSFKNDSIKEYYYLDTNGGGNYRGFIHHRGLNYLRFSILIPLSN